MPSERIAILGAELESICTKLAGTVDPVEREALLDEMRAILQELEVLTRLADPDLPH